MLRITLPRSRALFAGPTNAGTGPQGLAPRLPAASKFSYQRSFADSKKPDETLVPGAHSLKQPLGSVPPPAPGLEKPITPIIARPVATGNIPKLPPKPEDLVSIPRQTVTPPSTVSTDTGTASVAPPAGPTTPPKKKRRLRKFLTYLFILSALGYGAGVYYSLVSDNWHDFFTEYIPFGEDAVGYFEERQFKKRFPGSQGGTNRLYQQVRGEQKVKIPSRAGVSVQPAQRGVKSDLASNGPHVSAINDSTPKPPTAAPTTPEKPLTTPAQHEETSASHKLLPSADTKLGSGKRESSLAPVPASATAPAIKVAEPEPSKPVQVPLVDHISIENASEPVVQDVVKILNDLITAINADGAASKYSSTIATAKDNLKKVTNDINMLRTSEHKAAEEKIAELNTEFDRMAKQLLQRQEEITQHQEMRWKEEFEAEQKMIKEAYESKLKTELDEVKKVYDQKLRNELLEHTIALRREFTSTVRDRVEAERSGRLGKIGELSASVHELEKLTAEWNGVVDANLRTQHLIVAVEAVRAAVENAEGPRPFLEELAALKEVAADDPVVNAAIASINPTAYQRGIPTSAQLIDRFRRVAAEVRKAALLPENAGVASHVASLILSKVLFKKSGLPMGEDVESILTRTEVLLEEGNWDEAAREMNSLSGWSKRLSQDWLAECRKVLEVKQALEVIAAEARLQSLLVE